MNGIEGEARDGPFLSHQVSRQVLALCPVSIIKPADAWAVGFWALGPVMCKPELLPLLFLTVKQSTGRTGGYHFSASATIEEGRVPEAAWGETADGIRHPSNNPGTKESANWHHAPEVVLVRRDDGK